MYSRSTGEQAKASLCLSAGVTGLLTTVLLVAAVRAIIIIITSPQGRDATSVLALKLPGFTLRLRMSSCVVGRQKDKWSSLLCFISWWTCEQ